MKKTVQELATLVHGVVIGDPSVLIEDVTNISQPMKGCISFIDHPRYLKEAEEGPLSCLLVPQTITGSTKTLIQVANPKLSFARILNLFYPGRTFSSTIAPTARIDASAHIEEGVTIEDYVVIGPHVRIGKGSVIRSFSFIDAYTSIGTQTLIHPHVMIYDHMKIGDRVIIHSSTVVGSDGFGYVRNERGELEKIQQIGNVQIEDDVEIGSNVSIDRATFGSTIIKKGTKIDNLVQIAHNVTIGSHTTVSGHAGIAGSAHIGNYCTIAAQAGIGDHAILDDKVIIGGQAGVASKKRVPEGSVYMGTPARPMQHFREQQGLFAKLPRMIEKLEQQ